MKDGRFKVTGFFACVLSLAAVTPARAGDQPQTARYYRQQAAAAYKAKDYVLAAENFKKALALIPDHPTLYYNLAAVFALQGKKPDAVALLTKIAEMGLELHPENDSDFDSIKFSAEFEEILKRFEKNKTPIVRSKTAFTIPEKGLITEGLAYDPTSGAFFVSSVRKRRVLRVSKSGKLSTFATERDGLWSVLGMKVDQRRRLLWVTTTALPQMANFNKAEDGSSAVFKFDLPTGKLVKRYVLSNSSKKHALGDLTIQTNGDVFATDSLSAAVYVIRSRRDEIETFVEDPRFSSPQGLAFSSDERHLFMADYSTGLFDIDVRTGKVAHLDPIPGQTLLGIDGLYFYKGGLIGVQNGVTPQRIVRVELSTDLSRAIRVRVIESNNPVFLEPTLGVLVKDTFYFIANSQWPLIDENGRVADEDKLTDPLVLKIKLDSPAR